jgi:chromosome segregation protein
MGRNWIRIHRQADELGGALNREQQIQHLRQHIGELESAIETLETRCTSAEQSLSSAEQQLQELQNELHPEQSLLSGLYSNHAEIKTRLEQAELTMEQLQEDLDDLEMQESSDQEEIGGVRQRLERTGKDREKLEQQRVTLGELRDLHRSALDNARSQWHMTHEQSHEIALKLESISSQKASVEQAIQRLDIQLSNLMARRDELEHGIESSQLPLRDLERSLEDKLREKIAAESVLTDARDRVQVLDAGMRSRDQERLESEQQIQELRDRLEAVRMSAQESKVRLQTVSEQLEAGSHGDVAEILKELDESADRKTWMEKLDTVDKRINRLGPINLAAIDEYNQLSERKQYLDSQYADLSEAIATLENAIKKIDRETRTRFRETFDKLNKNLQEMFPILFGGGHAYLEMTGNDLLETGVTIMARPPGKRNSTIHLLSGGEKALTAVALVFSIFKLNPAPFCILDEVDAPLDDTNVGRFSNLVAEMSKEVQFIFITHNKITMEIAQQLLGVTMYEAGVSRLVSVDMEEAVEMAASA